MTTLHTIGDLREAIASYPPETPVLATWEGQFQEISVVRAANGTVVIDADGDSDSPYLAEIESGERPAIRPWAR